MVRNAAPWRWRASMGLSIFLSLLACAAAAPAFAQDSDGDGVPDPLEDVNGNLVLDDDNTDGDTLPNYLDDDDDGDGFPTRDEDWNGNGDWFDDDQGGFDDVPDFEDLYSPADDDGDGYVDLALGGDDCDDLAGGAHPDAFDQWYDGRDADCGGESDFDQDRDGFEVPHESGGDDCDDRNPEAWPGAEEDAGGADLDCDGFADPANPLVANGGCDCATGSPAPLAPALLLVLLGCRRLARRARGRAP